ncbi:hypothetical protein SERLA73DRAFT_73217 [Serpula lacrymans var. lacrymans S7.3]|uniref:Uncharacterized protein n=2 Tax=Serpula lacrymans var. lacrymans TaxID=341189 RepID=F8PV53_SERL3|nr:uncharacterized protein SERLADRAFT_437788 [Serpula lacrymans var. lacrymans S7.9]EGO00505.1 hypothetical protein SERLA73DRAFT_73217 [Serpula lacrymans var. lacrymans S7.3]EGO26054.1 hypothetical protein SERLADRAFT_437788 [Serpula lacrymans var. lacrymans S7.9]
MPATISHLNDPLNAHAVSSIDMIDPHLLPRPASPLFFPTLLAYIHSLAPSLPLDPVILQSLLLCLIAGHKNLILRTREEDVGLVSKLATLALSSIFGYTAHKSKLHSDAKSYSPSHLLHSLFFPPSTLRTDDPTLSPSKRRDRIRRNSTSRPSTAKQSLPPPSIKTPRSRNISFPRSLSYPSDSQQSSSAPHNTDGLDISSLAADLPGLTPRPNLHPLGVHTDPSVPTLLSALQDRTDYFNVQSLDLPSSVVVSGLEHASLPAQRALLQALTDRKLILHSHDLPSHSEQISKDFPPDFILVYVCRTDPHERPALYKSLLDRFAMSATVTVQSSTRIAMRQPHPYRFPSSPSSALPSPLNPIASLTHIQSHPSPSLRSSVLPPAAQPLISPSLLQGLHTLSTAHIRFRAPLQLYSADLFTAVRHYHELDGTLLTARSRKDAEDLIRAVRVLGADLTGAELLKEATRTHDDDTDADSHADSTSLQRPSERGSLHDDAASTSHSVDTKGGVPWIEEALELELDVCEADVARVFPRVVTHRLRVRDSPADEVLSSAVCGAVGGWTWWRDKAGETAGGAGARARARGADGTSERSTIKDILVHVLAEV